MKRVIQVVCTVFGFLFLGIGAIGMILPVLPTTPFLLLAAILFAKGSERFHIWFLGTELYQKYINQVVKKKAMTKRAKISVLLSLSVLFLIGFWLAPIWHAKVLIAAVAAAHFYFFLFKIRTVAENE